MNKYGCIYKTKKGTERIVITGYHNEALTSSVLNDSRVLAFDGRKQIAKFMEKFRGADAGSESSRHIDGNYKVIKLEPFYVLAGFRVREEDTNESTEADS